MDATNSNSRAGGPAAANMPDSVKDQTLVAKVEKPVGLSNRVAGNSFMTFRNTRAAAAPMPGRRIGREIRMNVRIWL